MTKQQVEPRSIPMSRGRCPHTDTQLRNIRRGFRTPDPDTSLVDGLRLQAPEAYDRLISAYAKRLKRTALRITMCAADAEDVVQDTFLQVFRNVDKFRGECQFGSWITTIAMNQARMAIRRRKTTIVSLDVGIEMGEDRAFHQIAGPGDTPEQICIRRELAETVGEVVITLRQIDRSVFEMYFVQELSLNEIAERLGITASASKSRLYRVVRNIRSRAVKKSWPTRQDRASRAMSPE